jgi:hypothetical protein
MKCLADTIFVKAVVASGVVMDHELEPVLDKVDWGRINIVK